MTDKVEMLDLVDADDKVIKTMSRDDIYAQDLKFVRVVEVFIRNSSGKLWIPVRLGSKRIAPGGYDVGIGGHVEHGETALEAFRKEVSEEAGWDIDDLKWHKLGKFGPKEKLNTISHVYEITTDTAPMLSADDFKSAEWLYPEEVISNINAGHPAKMNLVPLLRIIKDLR